MSEKRGVRAYTNVASQVGQPVPGKEDVTYKALPEPSYESETKRPKAPEPPDLDNFVAPDYSNRESFEQFVLEEIGINPFEMNPLDAVKESDKELPNLFRHIFKGKIIWKDRHKMNSKENDYWNGIVKKFHADRLEEAESTRDAAIAQYNFMMNSFDNSKKEYEARLDKYKEDYASWSKEYGPGKSLEEGEEARKAAIELDKTKAAEKRKEEAKIREEEREKTAKEAEAKKKAAMPKEPTREDVIAVAKYEDSILKDIELDEDGKIPKRQFDNMNKIRKAAGMPLLKQKVVGEYKKKSLFGFDLLWPDEDTRELEVTEGDGATTGEEKEIVETRMYKGRKIVKYSDGSIAWAK